MRIVSLLPSATEIVASLGLMDRLVGVSHDCDFPPEVCEKPRVTACEVADDRVPSAAVDRWVADRLAHKEALFTVDREMLRQLKPDLILTQALCDVCAPAYATVAAMAAELPGRPEVLTLEASTLEQILDTIGQVADALGVPHRGAQLLRTLRARIAFVRAAVGEPERRPRMVFLEWLEPVYCSGHWTPELVEIAGGEELLGEKGAPSRRRTWRDVAAAEPDHLLIACCGQRVERALPDWKRLREEAQVQGIRAVREGRVHLADGNAYFNRSGPRIVDSLEILAEIFYPQLFRGRFPDRGVVSCR